MTTPKFIQIKAMRHDNEDGWDETETWAGTTHICIYMGEPGAYQLVADFSKAHYRDALAQANNMAKWYGAEVERVQFDLVLATKDAQVDDGWVEWHGGECPVQPNDRAQVMCRNQATPLTGRALDFCWEHNGTNGDIVRYRIIKAKEQTVPETRPPPPMLY